MIELLRKTFVFVVLLGATGCSTGAWRAEPATPAAGVETALASATSSPLLYISNDNDGISIYDYGDGSAPKYMGSLNGVAFAEGECTDAAGNIYVTSESVSKIYEFEPGATKAKRILNDPYGYPQACAVDSKSGDLAVANEGGFNSSPGNAIVYAHAAGKPREYFASNLYSISYCGYDDAGNLFVDGWAISSDDFALAKLVRGGQSLKSVAVEGAKLSYPAAVQWSKPYLLVGDGSYHFGGGSAIYELSVKGMSATVEGTVVLKGSGQIRQFVKQGDRVVTADARNHRSIYAFPSGVPNGKIAKGINGAFGVAISSR